MKEKAIEKALSRYNISKTSLEVGRRIGFNKLIFLIRNNKLHSAYWEECLCWVSGNPQIKKDMERFDPLYFGEDARMSTESLLDSILFPDIIEIIERNDCGQIPPMLKAVLDVASEDMDSWRLEDCTLIGIGLDYLEEIAEYLAYLGLVPALC